MATIDYHQLHLVSHFTCFLGKGNALIVYVLRFETKRVPCAYLRKATNYAGVEVGKEQHSAQKGAINASGRRAVRTVVDATIPNNIIKKNASFAWSVCIFYCFCVPKKGRRHSAADNTDHAMAQSYGFYSTTFNYNTTTSHVGLEPQHFLIRHDHHKLEVVQAPITVAVWVRNRVTGSFSWYVGWPWSRSVRWWGWWLGFFRNFRGIHWLFGVLAPCCHRR